MYTWPSCIDTLNKKYMLNINWKIGKDFNIDD
jgi:hypothetical protein